MVDHGYERVGRKRRSGGQATIELAIFLPLFLLVLLGMIEMGDAWDKANRAAQAAHEAAEYARRMHGTDLDSAEAVARKFVGDSALITPSVSGSGSAPCGAKITFTVRIDKPLLTGGFLRLFSVFGDGVITIERKATALYIQT